MTGYRLGIFSDVNHFFPGSTASMLEATAFAHIGLLRQVKGCTEAATPRQPGEFSDACGD